MEGGRVVGKGREGEREREGVQAEREREGVEEERVEGERGRG